MNAEIEEYKKSQREAAEFDAKVNELSRRVCELYREYRHLLRHKYESIGFRAHMEATGKAYANALKELSVHANHLYCHRANPELWALHEARFGKSTRAYTWQDVVTKFVLEKRIQRGAPTFPILINESDEYFADRLAKFTETFQWFKRKDNRFKYNGDCSLLSCALYEAFERSVDYAAYVADNDILQKEKELASQLNALRVSKYEADLKQFDADKEHFVKLGGKL